MGRRREQRLVLTLPCKISGLDVNKQPFVQDCEAVDISRAGCQVRWIYCVRGTDDVVEIQHGKEKGRFKVKWIGEEGSHREGHIGLRSLDGKYIWGVALATPKPDAYAVPEPIPAAPAPAAVPREPAKVQLEPEWRGQDRRRYPRYRCPGEVEAVDLATNTKARGMVSDISLGGCYMDVVSPLASGTEVQIRVKTSGVVIETRGIVRASHPSMGMGLEFTEMSPENRARLDTLLAQLGHQFAQEVAEPAEVAGFNRYELSESDLAAPPPTPVLAPTPLSASTPTQTFETQVLLDTLLELLYSKRVLTREEFLRALEKAATSSRRD